MTISGEVPDILAAKGDVSSADKGARPADDVADVDFLRGVLAKEQQWRKSDFFWRLLLSSRELDLLTSEDRRAFGRNMTYYAANSERAQRLLRLLGIAFAIDLLFALGIPLWIYFARYGLSLPVESFKEFFLLILAPLLTVFALIQIVLSLAVAVVANIGGNKPYGMTFFNVLSRVMLGPWREIPDYDPDRPFPRV